MTERRLGAAIVAVLLLAALAVVGAVLWGAPEPTETAVASP
ncbi:MAG: hypothetical protein R2724_34730 [Bryobacterales bacterium]